MAQNWDFIIVGSGPAGSALASRLAQTSAKPRILLLEAGPRKDDPALRISGKRWTTFQNVDTNWGYKTVPQAHCNGREIDYSRGKVLGGSSAINFCVYSVGAKDDYDAWSEQVGDERFSWSNMQRRFIGLENFDMEIKNERYKSFANPDPAVHGTSGGLKLSYAETWEEDIPLIVDAIRQAGYEWNGDHNSGNPIGVALGINSVSKGVRTTAQDLLTSAGKNLEVMAGKSVRRVVFDGKRAIGVEVEAGEILTASKEVIISSGSLDTPKILMHSGIGPADQLNQFNIPILQALPAIGQNLADHPFCPLAFLRKPSTNNRNAFYGNQPAMDAAMGQWLADRTGPWTQHGSQLIIGWLKSDAVLASPEFAALPSPVRAFLNRPTIPHYEFASHFPLHMVAPGLLSDYSYVCLSVFAMNEQSRGSVRLQSADPAVPLLFDPNFLSHDYDKRACIEAVRGALAISKHDAFAKDTVSVVAAPASESEEDILAYWRENVQSAWHMTGTVRMGRDGEENAAVNQKFQVFGVRGLRVADMSVVPFLTNNHTQATAYVTGVTCAEVLIEEYGLDG
ncbi:hypothetical protein BDV18DRAFT_162893 [Aspergillus unguis]